MNHARSSWQNWRVCAACAVLASALAAGCIGGQTTVPTSATTEVCHPIEMRYFGPHTLDASWQRSTGSTASEGTTLLTVDVSRTAAEKSPCDSLIDVRVEVSSDDGVVELSGTGQLTRGTDSHRVRLNVDPGLEAGTIVLGETLEILLDFPNGDRFSASGALGQAPDK